MLTRSDGAGEGACHRCIQLQRRTTLRCADFQQKVALPRYESLQTEYNLYDRAEYEETLEPVCVENALGVLTYFSLASGFLTGKYSSAADVANKARGDFVKKYLNERGFGIVDALNQVAKRLHAMPAQVALAWLMARLTVTGATASATNLAQLKELIVTTKLRLDETSMGLLNRASAWRKP